MLRNLRKYEEREERSTTDSKSTLTPSSTKNSISSSPSIKLLSFRNFLPAFDPVLIEEYSHYVPEVTNFKQLQTEQIKRSLPFGSMSPSVHNEGDIILKAFQEGPFFIFTYTESLRSGCCKVLQSLEKLEIELINTIRASIDEESFLHEEDLSLVKLKEDEALYCIPKEQFLARMKGYDISENSWREQGVTTLKEKVETIQRHLASSQCQEKDLVLLSCIHKSLMGEFHRAFCRKTGVYYGVRNLRIRSPEMLTMVLRELDVLIKILESSCLKENNIAIVSVKIKDNSETEEDVELKMILDLSFGTLEEFSAFQKSRKETWDEEDLVHVTRSLLKQYKICRDLNIFIRDIRPSNTIVRRDFKGLRFLDFSLAIIEGENHDENAFEIIGMPKYMSSETLDVIKKAKLKRRFASQCDLYAIGAVVLSVIPEGEQAEDSQKEYEITMSQDRSTEERNRIMQQYPILWKKYLEKLLDNEPSKREEVLAEVQLDGKEEEEFGCGFLKKFSKDFESYLVQKDYGGRKDLLEGNADVFLDHFWESKNLKLVDKMQENIIDKFSKGGETLKKSHQFIEKVAGLYEAEKSYDKLTEVYEKWIKTLDAERSKKNSAQSSEEVNATLIDYNNKLGDAYQAQGVYNKALQKYERAMYLKQLQNKTDNEPLGSINGYMKIGEMYEKLERYDLAIETYKKAQNKTRECFGTDKNQLQQAILHERIARVNFKKSDFSKAIEAVKQAIESYTICYGQYHESVGGCEKLLGDILMKAESPEEAFTHYERYFCVESYGSNKSDLAVAELMDKIGDYYKGKDLLGKAVENYQRGLKIFEYHANQDILFEMYEKLSECFGKQRRYMVAVNYLRSCLKIKIEKLGEESLEIIPTMQKIANYLVQEGEHKEALSEYSRALGIALLHKPGDEDPLVVELLKSISKISPLAFLSYKNYSKKKGDKNTILISLNSLEDVRGVIEGIDFGISLDKLRGMIVKECSYFKFFKYEFVQGGKIVDMVDERSVKVQECVLLKEGFNHVVIKEDKSLGLKGRFTF